MKYNLKNNNGNKKRTGRVTFFCWCSKIDLTNICSMNHTQMVGQHQCLIGMKTERNFKSTQFILYMQGKAPKEDRRIDICAR
jgi:hypothetical protein